MSFSVLLVMVTVLVSFFSVTHSTPSPLFLHGLSLNLTRNPFNLVYKPVVAISVGTPPVEVVLLMDTGSSLTWTQCQPCPAGCFKQHPPYYNSAASKTFRKVSCGDGGPICKKCVHGECLYNITYGRGRTEGLAATDTFSFPGGASAAGVVFGCSKSSSPLSYSPSSRISGIMGLARAPESFLNQLFPPQKRRLSYCLARFGSGKVPSTTIMTFGDHVPAKTPLRTTPFVDAHDRFHLYNLNLLDISVGNRRLGFPAGTFGVGRGQLKVIIDSGTALPILPGKPYTAVMGEFERHYTGLGLKRIESPPEAGPLEFCYQRPAGFGDYMNLTYHFEGADYFVHSNYTSLVRKVRSLFCVAVQPRGDDGDLVVLGSWHQQNTRIVYDVSAGQGHLGFGPECCN